MLNFPGYDVSESRRLFNGEIQAPVSVGHGSIHRGSSSGYIQGFTDQCYDSTASVNPVCPPTAGYGQPLTGYPVSTPTYGAYRHPFAMSHAAAVYEEQRKFDCYNKSELNCSASLSAHGNYDCSLCDY